VDPGLGLREATRGFLEIKTKDNKTYAKRVDRAYGHPHNPISKEDLVKKFMDCVDKAAKSIPMIQLEKAAKDIMTLEEVEEINGIVGLFQGKNNL